MHFFHAETQVKEEEVEEKYYLLSILSSCSLGETENKEVVWNGKKFCERHVDGCKLYCIKK